MLTAMRYLTTIPIQTKSTRWSVKTSAPTTTWTTECGNQMQFAVNIVIFILRINGMRRIISMLAQLIEHLRYLMCKTIIVHRIQVIMGRPLSTMGHICWIRKTRQSCLKGSHIPLLFWCCFHSQADYITMDDWIGVI